MKIKELIDELKKYDNDLEVVLPEYDIIQIFFVKAKEVKKIEATIKGNCDKQNVIVIR